MGPYELLEKIVAVLEKLHIPYLVTGSVAAMAYGEPRLTNDIDIVAAITGNRIPALISAFPAAEFCISDDMIREAIRYQSQFNIIHPGSGLKVDIMIRRSTPFDAGRFARVRAGTLKGEVLQESAARFPFLAITLSNPWSKKRS